MKNKFRGQINAVLDYINVQIRKDWTGSTSLAFCKAVSIETLSKKAGMSQRNFQIWFNTFQKTSVAEYIFRLRREYALQLIKEEEFTYSQIAQRIGLVDVTTLYNMFRLKFECNSSEDIEQSNKAKQQLSETISYEFRTLHETPILFLSYIGNYNMIADSVFEVNCWERLYEFALEHDLLPIDEEYWGICFDNRNTTDPEKCRFYACLSINKIHDTKETDEIKCMIIPSATYAVFTYKGDYGLLDDFYEVALENIPAGYTLNDNLFLERYLTNAIDTACKDLVTELWIPLSKE